MTHRPITTARSQWTEHGTVSITAEQTAAVYYRRVGDGTLSALVAEEPAGWHLSVSFTDHRGRTSRYPRWDEIADARYSLAPDDIDMVMHLPPPAEYVAVHPTTFHLHEHPERTG